MSYARTFLIAALLILASICVLPAYSAFEDEIAVIEMKNISFSLSSEQDYIILTNSTVATSIQEILINSTVPDGGNASVVILSMSLGGQEGQSINHSQISSFMENMVIGMLKIGNARELEGGVVKSAKGENVTLHRFIMQSSINEPAEEVVAAFWDLDEYNHVLLLSTLGINASAEIVETFEMKT